MSQSSEMNAEPLIIYVPGLKPKPRAEEHRDALLLCLLEGMRRIDPAVAADLRARKRCFEIVAWTHNFYGIHRDIGLDLQSIRDVLAQQEETAEDKAEATTFQRRMIRALYQAADHLPFLIPHFANEKMELHLRDLRRYVSNNRDIAELTRQLLKAPLIQAAEAGRPILLLAHSMGSVIAFDSLWQLSRKSAEEVPIDLLVTMGSPLGQKYIQRRMLGSTIKNERRYPGNIRRWINIAAVGELTAIYPILRNAYAPMLEQHLVDDIQDLEIYNYYREGGRLNIHAEYGYLVSEAAASTVCGWWKSYCE